MANSKYSEELNSGYYSIFIDKLRKQLISSSYWRTGEHTYLFFLDITQIQENETVMHRYLSDHLRGKGAKVK